MTDNERDVEIRLRVLDAEMSKLGGAQAAIRRFNGDASTGFRDTAVRAKAAKKELDGMGRLDGLKAAASSITGLSFGIAGIVVAATSAIRAFGDATRAASAYQARILEISTLSDMTAGQMATMSEGLRDLSVKYGQVNTVMAKAQYDVMSSGFTDAAESMGILDVASRAAIGGVTNVATSAKLLTQVINAYGMKASDAGAVSDILFATVRDGVTTFEELAANLGNVTSTAATAKISLAEVSAAIAVMTKKGIATPEAVTALNGLIVALGAATGESKKKLDELGISLDNGLAPALRAINENGGESLAVLRELVPDMRALKGAAAAGAEGARELREEIEIIGKSAGVADAAYSKMAGSMELSSKRLDAAQARLKQSVGAVFAKERTAAMNNMASAINDIARGSDGAANTMDRLKEAAQLLSDPLSFVNRLSAKLSFDSIDSVPRSMGEATIWTDKYADSVKTLDGNFLQVSARAKTMAGDLTRAAEEAAAAATAANLASLQSTAAGFGIAIKEIGVSVSGAKISVDRSPEELKRDIQAYYQNAADTAARPIFISFPWKGGLNNTMIGDDATRDFGRFRNVGQRSFSIVENSVLSLSGAISGSLSNALMDSKAKLIDIESIGRSFFSTVIGALVNLGTGYLFPELKPALGLSALGGPVPAFGPRIVGEYGPEIFTPETSGRITPSNKTRAVLSGGSVGSVHIDARSTINLPSSSVIFMDSPAAMRRLAETTSRITETKIRRTYKERR